MWKRSVTVLGIEAGEFSIETLARQYEPKNYILHQVYCMNCLLPINLSDQLNPFSDPHLVVRIKVEENCFSYNFAIITFLQCEKDFDFSQFPTEKL